MASPRLADRLEADYRAEREAFEKRAAEMLKAKKITPGEVEGARRAFNTRFAQQASARQDRLKQITAAGMPENTAFPGAAKFLQPIGSAALGFLDAAGMGAGQMATGEEGKLFLESRAARNPIAFNVGQFAGSVLGAPGKIGGALTAGLGASAAPALTRAAGNLATRIPAEIAVGAGANALASGAITTAESVASGKDAVQVLRDVSTSMKFGAAFGAAGGSLAAGFRTRSVDKAGQQLLAEAKRIIPGLRVDPTFLRQESNLQAVIRALAPLPGGRGVINRYYQEGYLKPLRRSTDNLVRAISGGRNLEEAKGLSVQAGEIIRDVVGPDGSKSGRIAETISRLQNKAFNSGNPPEKDKIVDPKLFTAFLGMVNNLRLENLRSLKSRGTSHSNDMIDALSRVKYAAKRALPAYKKWAKTGVEPREGRRVTLQMLEDWKQAFDNVAGYDMASRSASGAIDASQLSIDNANEIRGVLRAMEASLSTPVDRAMRASQVLHAQEQELRGLVGAAKDADPSALLARLTGGRGTVRQVVSLHRQMSEPEREILAGAYIADFMRRVVRDTETQSGKGRNWLVASARRLMGDQAGKFRPEAFDRIVGAGDPRKGREARKAILTMLETSDRVGNTFGPTGSETASRLVGGIFASEVYKLPETVLNLVEDRNFMRLVAEKMGAPFTYSLIKSTMQGGVAENLNRLATGRAALTPIKTTIGIESLRQNMGAAGEGLPLEAQP